MAKKRPARTGIGLNDPVTAYALAVTKGKILAGPYVRAACKRHLDDLEFGPARGLRWDLAAAMRAIEFFRDCLTVEVEEQDEFGESQSLAVPFILQPWQCFIVGSLFGWKNAKGFRRFRRAYVEIGKGNGKSPMAAGIGHYMLTAQRKLKPEVYAAATDLNQAKILYKDAVSMRDRSPALKRRISTVGEKEISNMKTAVGGEFKPISAEKKGKSGYRPFCALLDEIHEHADNSVIEMMRAGTKGNQEALIFEITNSGFDKKTVCGQEHDYTVSVVTGVLPNDAWFGYITAMDTEKSSPTGVADDPFLDEACWIKANPNLGVSIYPDYIREQVQEARGMPSKEGLVRRLNFCQWTESENCAIPRAVYEACEGEVDLEAMLKGGYRCFGGLDLSRVKDLTAFTLTWLLDETKDHWKFASRTWFWTPMDTLVERQKTDKAPYVAWEKAKYLEGVPGKRVAYPWVASALGSLCARFDPEVIGCDQYGLEQLRDHLDMQGIDLPCEVHPQGFNRRVVAKVDKKPGEETGADEIALWMPDSINKTEAALYDKRITIQKNPVMAMCAGSVVYTENRTGARMFDKSKATHRIDGMVSLAMSIGMATLEKPESQADALNRAIIERGGLA